MWERAAKVVLVGSPNVGKSAVFNYLTGSYVAVSNYPGTTVDISTGHFKYKSRRFEVIDTPGIYSLISLTDEERVTRHLLASNTADVIVHVVDAKNLRRMLHLTLHLIDAGWPVILNLNIMDEARNLGLHIDIDMLEEILGIPVVATSAVNKTGMELLKNTITTYEKKVPKSFQLRSDIEQAISDISNRLSNLFIGSRRLTSILLLEGDPLILDSIKNDKLGDEIAEIIKSLATPRLRLPSLMVKQRQETIDQIIGRVLKHVKSRGSWKNNFTVWLGRVTREPFTGIPILCLVLYFGLYQFVGRFGAGYLVDYINNSIFVPIINPVVEGLALSYVPWDWLRSLLVGEYGIFTMGFRYAIAIILPIVGTFFLAFAVLEDSGYLPRLAMLVDLMFKFFGLNGRAIIPLTLGLGCGTMAVMVTRTLESSRERLLATFLLSLTIPCSAQLGVVLALLSQRPFAVAVWCFYLLLIFIFIGWLSAKLVPGKRSPFYMEIPPLRPPLLGNVIKKAYTRMAWYFMEILPVFIITSIALWLGDISGVLSWMILQIEPFMTLAGLPIETAQAFLLGFFRRDYGAAGLYDLTVQGRLTDMQLVVTAIALTLFVPCVAQLSVMIKERGMLVALTMVGLIVSIAFGSAVLTYNILKLIVI